MKFLLGLSALIILLYMGVFYFRSCKKTGDEYISNPCGFWRLILKEGLKEELPVFPIGQDVSVSLNNGVMSVDYSELKMNQLVLDISLHFEFTIRNDEIIATVDVKNNDRFDIVEVVFPLIDGIFDPPLNYFQV